MYELPMSRLMLLTAGVLLSMAGLRWHQAAAAAPDRIAGVDEPTVVLLVQPGDCPQRRAAMVGWLAAFRAGEAGDDGPSVSVAVLKDEPGALPEPLAKLPRLDRADTRSVARAVLRAGIPGTPALVLVGTKGTVLLADTFSPTGVGPRLIRAATLLPALSLAAQDLGTPETAGSLAR